MEGRGRLADERGVGWLAIPRNNLHIASGNAGSTVTARYQGVGASRHVPCQGECMCMP